MGLLFSKYGSKLKWLNVVYFIMCVSCLIYFGSKIVFAGDPSGTVDYGADGTLNIDEVSQLLGATGSMVKIYEMDEIENKLQALENAKSNQRTI